MRIVEACVGVTRAARVVVTSGGRNATPPRERVKKKDPDESDAKRRHGGVEKAARAGAVLSIDAQGRQVGGLVQGLHERRHFTQSPYEGN